jgi:hypothetical protein
MVSSKNMTMNIPLILRLKLLKENKKYFLIVVIFYYIAWVILGIKVGAYSQLKTDYRLYFHLPVLIYVIWAANLIVESYIRVFNVDLYKSSVITEKFKECRKIEKAFGEKEIANIQHKVLELICNRNEKSIIVIGSFLFGLLIFISDYFITKTIGTMYGINMSPWTPVAYWMNYLYWVLFIIPLFISLVWIIVGMLRGITLMWNTYELKSRYSILNIKPVLDLIYLMSSLIIIFSFLYTLSIVYITKILPMPFYYIFNLLVVAAGLAIFIWPQLSLHEALENIKENILLNYYKLYEDKTNYYLKLINQSNDNSATKEDIEKDISFVKDMIAEAEELDTWPFFSRIKQLIGAGLGSIIMILLQALKII